MIKEINNFEVGPEHYAAIYARKSIKNENNSIEGQIELGYGALEKNQLILYRTYEDNIPARQVPAFERKGFQQLIYDARAGYFKTVIAYRHDRLARDISDWYKIKNEFKSLGIKIIFTDENEFQSNDSSISNFIENLLIMIAAMEPKQTLLRASKGREIRRLQGVYTAGNYGLFGYDSITEDFQKYLSEDVDKSIKIKTYYKINCLESFIAILIFVAYNEISQAGDKNECIGIVKQLLRPLKHSFEKLTDEELTKIFSDPGVNAKDFIEKISYSSVHTAYEEKRIWDLFQTALSMRYNQEIAMNKVPLDEFKKNVFGIFAHFERDSNFTLLKNSRYCGKQLINTKEKKFAYFYDEPSDSYTIDLNYFNRVINLEPILPVDKWQKAACHFLKYTNTDTREKKYLFRNLLVRKKCGNKMYLFEDGFFKCTTPGCTAIDKNSLTLQILNKLVGEAFKSDNFKTYMDEQLNAIITEISKNQLFIENKEVTIRNNVCNFLKDHSDITAKEINKLRKDIGELKASIQSLQFDYQNLKNLIKKLQSLNSDEINTIIQNLLEDEMNAQNLLLPIVKSIEINYVESLKGGEIKIGFKHRK